MLRLGKTSFQLLASGSSLNLPIKRSPVLSKALCSPLKKAYLSRSFSSNASIFSRDIGKEASQALSVSSSRSKEEIKSQKRNSFRRLESKNSEEISYLDQDTTGDSFVTKHTLQCRAYCTAEEYNFEILLPIISSKFKVSKVTDDVYNIQLDQGEVFLFKDGTFVHWGESSHKPEWFLDEIIKSDPNIERGKYEEYETEYFYYHPQNTRETYMAGDVIYLEETPDVMLYKLAFSHGLARSAKLSVLEDLLDSLLKSMSHYPLILQDGKKIPLTRKEILHKLGDVFLLRGLLNLQSESFLDTPDYYWSKPQLERCYDAVSKNLDVRPRISILNKKLDYANELTGLLREQLSEAHSHKLEWCIISLITVEVLFEIAHYVDRFTN
ncbi:hypothetical protein DSO57_1000107 [Entomophthora muscae]|uniref:Uncharacterized protein n=1 Tax=Entomophthora muscae TaxID=34485 RepID=A0ACC2SMA0_9FUNG|nr:hypothetical protein DSO57_1000107 [Entomophthora muscae]